MRCRRRRVRYYQRFLPPGGLPRVQLFGVYTATANDGDKQLYAALLRRCESDAAAAAATSAAAASSSSSGGSGSSSSGGGSGSSGSGSSSSSSALEARVQGILDAAVAQVGSLTPAERAALLHGPDPHAAAEQLLGMRVFLGGVSHADFSRWAAAVGYAPAGKQGAARSKKERRGSGSDRRQPE